MARSATLGPNFYLVSGDKRNHTKRNQFLIMSLIYCQQLMVFIFNEVWPMAGMKINITYLYCYSLVND